MHPEVSINCSPCEPVTALLGAGSNLGDRRFMLESAANAIDRLPGCRLDAVSSIYMTVPVNAAGGEFLNAVFRISTTLSPVELLASLKAIEGAMGRTGSGTDARTIDLDILFYGNVAVDLPGITIPHPRWATRRFVLIPLAEVCADVTDPITGRPVSQLDCMTCEPGPDVVRTGSSNWFQRIRTEETSL